MALHKQNAREFLVKGLHKAFGANVVLQGIDLDIRQGELVAIVGGSGCGKTVLLNIILGQINADKGQVQVADHGKDQAPLVDLIQLSTTQMDQLHTHWGVVFQANALFSGSVFDNIQVWLDEIKHLKSGEILAIAKRSLAAVALPVTDDFLGRDVNELSGGMAKRLAVARALSMAPNVIFYDEPTTGLDPTSAGQIQDLILATHEQAQHQDKPQTTFIITHDKDLLNRLEPRIIMLHQGKVFFDGAFEDFFKSTSAIVRPYFDRMPVLHSGAA
ncbi:MAG: ATP-binding cassette domain-containing protein [Magnetovibrio sp.]|nr:ATP-binding cassette domain-containing protein [Magnetovibrio sp.]